METKRSIVCCLVFHGDRLLSGSYDGCIKGWDSKTLEPDGTPIEGSETTVRFLLIDEPSNRLFSTSDNMTLKVWKVDTLKLIHTLPGINAYRLALHPANNRLYIAGHENTIKMLDSVSFEPLLEMIGHTGSVYSLCLSEDGSRLFSGSVDKSIKVWDTASNICIATMEGHTHSVMALCLTGRGNLLISGSYKMIKVWDLLNNTCVHTITEAHSDWIQSIAFSSVDDLVYSCTDDGQNGNIKQWKLMFDAK
jgi:WD40 repeat protein